MDKIYKTYYESPLGILEITGNNEAVLSISFVEDKEETQEIPGILSECLIQIDEYFKGKRKEFSFKIAFEGTDFQRKVWNSLTKIPYGKTATYRDIAEAVGNIKAVRAVGSANSKNPLAIAVPCHRVIGSDGTLTGYAGGLWRKEWLLNHEKSLSNTSI